MKPEGPRPRRKGDLDLPSVTDIRAWLAATLERPKASAAARAFGIKGVEPRRAFKLLFKQAQGDSEHRGHGHVAGGLPAVTLFRIVGADADGRLLAAPDRWDGPAPAPTVVVDAGKRHDRLSPGVRLIARVEARPGGPIARPIRILPGTGGGAAGEAELAVVAADHRGRLSLKAARPGRERFWSIAGAAPAGLGEGDLALVSPLAPKPGPRGRDYRARVLSIHGRADDPAAYGLAMMAAQEAPIAFPDAVEAAAAAATPPALTGRDDLRQTPLLTIDSADARDFDDAVFAEPVGKGWRVIVAIADVSHYVRPGGPLDDEARLRGNSTYLPDRAIPMLPEALSNGLCSLKPAEDRACLYVEMRFDHAGKRTAARFGRGMMRSRWRLTYEAAATAAEPDCAEDYTPTVAKLYGAFACLTLGRKQRAPLELDLPERVVTFDAAGKAVSLGLRQQLSSHRLIEEFMVQANAAAAEALLAAGAVGLYRVHGKPDPERLGLLAETAAELGAAAPGARMDRPRDLNQLLASVDDSATRTVLSELILRSQAQARYQVECEQHFGLALDAYSHFTSPIRRYADLVVHRALIAALNLGDGGRIEDEAALETTADDINRTERRSSKIERATLDRYGALIATLHVGETHSGRIVGANSAGLFVRFDDPVLEGFAPAALLPSDYWRLSRDGLAMEGANSRKTYRVGDAIDGRIRDADAATGGVTIEILSTGGRPPQRAKRFTRRRR